MSESENLVHFRVVRFIYEAGKCNIWVLKCFNIRNKLIFMGFRGNEKLSLATGASHKKKNPDVLPYVLFCYKGTNEMKQQLLIPSHCSKENFYTQWQ